MPPFAIWSVASCSVAGMVGVRVPGRETTAGRRDKRRGTPARYVFVVVGIFTPFDKSHSAARRRNAKQRSEFDGTIARTMGISS